LGTVDEEIEEGDDFDFSLDVLEFELDRDLDWPLPGGLARESPPVPFE